MDITVHQNDNGEWCAWIIYRVLRLGPFPSKEMAEQELANYRRQLRDSERVDQSR
jgi:hypothetical protein